MMNEKFIIDLARKCREAASVRQPSPYSEKRPATKEHIADLNETNDILRDLLNASCKLIEKKNERIKEIEGNIDAIMREIPVGNLKAHTVENAPDFVSHYVSETARLTIKIEELEKERDALLAVVKQITNTERHD